MVVISLIYFLCTRALPFLFNKLLFIKKKKKKKKKKYKLDVEKQIIFKGLRIPKADQIMKRKPSLDVRGSLSTWMSRTNNPNYFQSDLYQLNSK
jgi:hypothetical protein